jgi:tRNA pseudouridine38/39 synthase
MGLAPPAPYFVESPQEPIRSLAPTAPRLAPTPPPPPPGRQVRCIAAILLMVGRGEEEPSVVARLLDAAAVPRKPQYAIADEAPLLLHACEFEGLRFGRAPRALARAAGDVRRHMERHLVAAAMCGEILDTLAPDLAAAGAAAAADGAADEAGGGGGTRGGGEPPACGRGRKERRAGGHIPLLSPARATEMSLEERFERLGIPLELLNKAGPAGFAEGE